MEQKEIEAAYTQGRESIEDLFKDGPKTVPFLCGVLDEVAQLIVDCDCEDVFNECLEWAKEVGDGEPG